MAGTVTLRDGRTVATVTDAVTTMTLDYRVGAVAEMRIGMVDRDGVLVDRGILQSGTQLAFDGEKFEVAAVDTQYVADGLLAEFGARSGLGRRLRNMMGPETTGNVTPGHWISQKVAKAGGRAVVEAGARRRTIVQKRDESVLDVIAALAGDTSTEWVEVGGVVFVGTGWWALQGGTGLPMWPLSVGRTADTAVTALATRSSTDDRTEAASASVEVPHSVGARWRPWHRVTLSGAAGQDNGVWLIQDVTFGVDESSTVTATLTRPRKSSPTKGSTGTAPSGTGGLPPSGSTAFRDAPRPAGWSGRSVAQIVATYRANATTGVGAGIINACLFTAQEVAGYPHIGLDPNHLWPSLPSARRHTNKVVPPGAILMYTSGRRGHATVYLGGGLCLSTDMDAAGTYAAGRWSIGPADKVPSSFGCTYVGWYSP